MTKRKRQRSRSDAQINVEAQLIKSLGRKIAVPLQPRRIKIGRNRIDLDGYYENHRQIVVAEAWSHVGKAKSAQKDKVLADVLKLWLVKQERVSNPHRKKIKCYYAFADTDAARVLRSESWGSLAARQIGIEAVLIRISSRLRRKLVTAQRNQDLRRN
jgi:hypothetical protein